MAQNHSSLSLTQLGLRIGLTHARSSHATDNALGFCIKLPFHSDYCELRFPIVHVYTILDLGSGEYLN